MDETTVEQPVNLLAGYLGYGGRTDLVPPATTNNPGTWPDVFKAADCKVSRFESESVLIEHPAVAEGLW